MNGAQEAILEELLANAKEQTEILKRLAGSFSASGSGGGGGLGAGLAGMATGLGKLNPIINIVAASFNFLSNVVGKIFSVIGSVVGAFVNLGEELYKFSKKAMDGTAKLSDFYDAFSGIPILGKFFSIFADIVRVSERLLTVYQNISGSGATFGGDLFRMGTAATNAYLTLAEFQKVIKQNSDTFAFLGEGSVQAGLNRFLSAQQLLMGPGSKYSEGIFGLGVTAEQASNYLATVIRNERNINNERKSSSSELAAKTQKYILELDELARLTGVEREELDKRVKKIQADQMFQTIMDGMNEGQRAAAQAMLTAATPFGDDVVAEVKARIAGLDVPVTELGNSIAPFADIFSPGGELRTALNKTPEEATNAILKYIGGMSNSLSSQLTGVFNPALVASGALGKFPNELLRLGRELQRTGGDMKKALANIAQEQKDAMSGGAGRLAQAEQNIKLFGQKLLNIFYRFIEPITGPLVNLGESIFKSVDEFLGSEGIQKKIEAISKWFGSFITDVQAAYKNEGLGGVIRQVFVKLGEGANNIWTTVAPIWFETIQPALVKGWNTLIDALQPYWEKLLLILEDLLNKWVYSLPGGKLLFGAENPEERAKGTEIKRQQITNQQNIDRTTSLINALMAQQGMPGAPADLQTRIESNKKILSDLTTNQASLNEQYYQYDLARKSGLIGGSRAQSNHPELGIGPGVRHTGTIGMTGNWWEKSDATLNVQAGETVLTQGQLAQIIDTSSQSSVGNLLQQLNTYNAQIAAQLKLIADNTGKTHRAAEALSRDLWTP